MVSELKQAIENLYETFSVYPLKPTMEACPCCVSSIEKGKIHTKQLRTLNEEDLERYVFKAMSTWGSVEDFKHYLPRILELLSTGDFMYDVSLIVNKLEYGNWRNWTENERNSILEFMFVWWRELIKNLPYFHKEAFIGIYKLSMDIDNLLKAWEIDFANNSFRNYVELVHDYFNDLMNKQKEFRELEASSIQKIVNWIKTNSAKLEEGFFYFEP